MLAARHLERKNKKCVGIGRFNFVRVVHILAELRTKKDRNCFRSLSDLFWL